METELSPINMADIGLNRFPTQTFMCCISMAAIKSIELTLKLNEINRFPKPNLTDTFHQIIHFALIDHALVRAINELNRHRHSPFHKSGFCGNEAILDALGKDSRQETGVIIFSVHHRHDRTDTNRLRACFSNCCRRLSC